MSLASGFLPLQILGQLVNIGTLLAFALVCVGVIILRKKRPDLERPFKVPFMPVVPILGVLACVGLMATLPLDTWLRLAIWLAIGLAIYFTLRSFQQHAAAGARTRSRCRSFLTLL